MAEETAFVDEKKLTKLCANLNSVNTVVKSPSERLVSGLRATENITGEQTAAGGLIMGASFQPIRRTTEVLEDQKEPPKRDDSYPSSLHSTDTSCSSYSLEISTSTTTTNNSNKESRPLPLKTPPESRNGQNRDAKRQRPLDYLKPVSSVTNSYKSSDPKPLKEKQEAESKFSQCQDKLASSEIVTAKSSTVEPSLEKTFLSSTTGNGKVGAQPIFINQPPKPTFSQEARKSDSFSTEYRYGLEEEDIFYAFVILHAQEDSEVALRLKSKLESISSTTGATFSEDFAVPGQSIFSSVEDAIENSAFVMLLLTPKFNTCLNYTSTDSALMNSIEKPYKYNTVIPLLPRVNGLTRDQMPFILRTKNPLDETKDGDIFEKMVQKVLDLKTIQKQKSKWRQEQLVKKQREKQQRLQEEKRFHRYLIQEDTKVRQLQEQVQQLQMQRQCMQPTNAQQPNAYQDFPERSQSFGHVPIQSPSGNLWQQPPSHIHIQNAKCIMIGNNSTMTVGDVVDSADEDNF